NQWQQWSQDIIPALLKPYMCYLEASQSLCMTVDPSCINSLFAVSSLTICDHFVVCSCDAHVYPGLEDVGISYCACTPAPICLMGHGLFASSPVVPTLAVDLCVLEFVKKLFVWLTPNTTAWCEALESFLDGQGYRLQFK
ncbi:hypothetical protein F5J12DRAFT_685875, partial [Pisolithus orientalis]|uniref:uncharacterized protein n=1 Tax=Pisolithus orientalis TaxID=936130 RepID=UPI002224A831